MRIEKDSLGELEVPSDAYYGIHTCRSLQNFGGAAGPLPIEIIYAMVKIKIACARANEKMGLISPEKGQAIITACDKVLVGCYDNQFPVDVFQAGSGTSSNMNVNEVIANLACEELGGQRGDRTLVHPNDDVNKGQSTNNVFPSAIRLAAVEGCGLLLPALRELIQALRAKEQEFISVLKSARTHLQDAVPIRLGQEFGAWAHALEKMTCG